MLVARLVDGEVHVVDRLRDRVALASGLDERKHLSKEVRLRALTCLKRFGERLQHMPRGSVRAVGTNTMRQVRDGGKFMDQAQDALGHPIEIIAGREEARLVYLGVAHSIENPTAGKRLVVDIGGGSTECVIGEGFTPIEADSLYMGCVVYSMRFFPDGEITRERFDEAQLAASLELQSIERRFASVGWDHAVGSSGTILSVQDILTANGWSEKGITPRGLRKLRKALSSAGHISKIALQGMPPDRAPVLAGGVAILLAIFDILGVERMEASQGALREGLVYDLLGRFRHEDVRELTIKRYSERYHVDVEQAARVEATAVTIFDQVADSWELFGEEPRNHLQWACRLHEIGLSVSYSGFHKHGAYLVMYSDMPGFSREDQHILSAIVRGHRRKWPAEEFEEMPEAQAAIAEKLCILLRVSVRLNRGRSVRAVPAIGAKGKKRSLHLTFPPGWLETNVLAHADLEEEAVLLRSVGYRLTFE